MSSSSPMQLETLMKVHSCAPDALKRSRQAVDCCCSRSGGAGGWDSSASAKPEMDEQLCFLPRLHVDHLSVLLPGFFVVCWASTSPTSPPLIRRSSWRRPRMNPALAPALEFKEEGLEEATLARTTRASPGIAVFVGRL